MCDTIKNLISLLDDRKEDRDLFDEFTRDIKVDYK